MQVQWWITFNEPLTFTAGYESENAHAPAINLQGYGRYLAVHTVLKAHANAYHLYADEFKAEQQGESHYYSIFLLIICTGLFRIEIAILLDFVIHYQ